MGKGSKNNPEPEEGRVRRITRELDDMWQLWKTRPAVAIVVGLILIGAGYVFFGTKFDLFSKKKAESTSVSKTGPKRVLMPDDIHRDLDECFGMVLSFDADYASSYWMSKPFRELKIDDQAVQKMQDKWTAIRISTMVDWDNDFSNEVQCMDLAFKSYHKAAYVKKMGSAVWEQKHGQMIHWNLHLDIDLLRVPFTVSNLVSETEVATGAKDTDEPFGRVWGLWHVAQDTSNSQCFVFLAEDSVFAARQALHHAQDGFSRKLDQ